MTDIFPPYSAIDIKELKILNIGNRKARINSSVTSKVVSAPVAVPKGDPRSVEKVESPQHCSKSYGERHLDVPGQPKGFRRRHNSCKFGPLEDTNNFPLYVAVWRRD